MLLKITLWITKVLGHSSGLLESQGRQEQGSKPPSAMAEDIFCGRELFWPSRVEATSDP